jgi:uncharacterized protein YqeY
MKAKDQVAVSALRSALAALANAEASSIAEAKGPVAGPIAGARLGVGAAEATRRDLTEDDVIDVLRDEIQERTTAATDYERLGRPDQAERLRAEAAVLGPFLED